MKNESILIGGFYATKAFFNYLKKYEYRLIYDETTNEVRISAFTPDFHESDTTGLLLLKFEKVPEETVEKLAQMLDLVETRIPHEHSQKAWKSRIPLVQVYHDGSPAADRAISQLAQLELPYHVRHGCMVFMLQFGRGNLARCVEFKKKDESRASLSDVIRSFGDKYGKLKEKKKVA